MNVTFCGASVLSFNTSVNWDSPSRLSVRVVEDPDNGDLFNPPPVGTPVYFSFGALYFGGLLGEYSRTNSVSGLPTYELICVDPREILEGTEIITGAYHGAISVDNLLNAFGWWENLTGFGSAQVNEGGMPWNKVLFAINSMTSTLAGTIYGKPLKHNKVAYSLDLSKLPVPPAYYRVASPNIGLLTVIQQICIDGGCDFLVDLIGFTIRIRVISRVIQPPLGTIAALTSSGYGVDLIDSKAGVSSVHEITSAFVIGPEQHELYMTGGDAITPFWGLDATGKPIIGTGSGLTHSMTLNATPIKDILGATTYDCDVAELCFAKVNYESWAAYVTYKKPAIAEAMGLIAPYKLGAIAANFGADFVNQDKARAVAANLGNYAKLTIVLNHQVYSFVKHFADDYMGKKFLIGIPFVLNAVDIESLREVYSQEPTDEGGYLPEGAAPLGLPPLYEDVFKNDSGRFMPFALFSTGLTGLDFSTLNPDNIVLGADGLYVKGHIERYIVKTPAPAIIFTLDNPIYEKPVDPVGGIDLIATVLGEPDPKKIIAILRRGAVNLPVKIHPAPHQPDFAAVPLRNNLKTYGPWYLQGAQGKVKFDQNHDLAPWNYGGYPILNLAAMSYVSQVVTNQILAEAGSITKVGAPLWNLGDFLGGGTAGPVISSMDVSYGQQGITTIYHMRTYTPRPGDSANKQSKDRTKKFSIMAANMRKSLRQALTQGTTQTALTGINIGNFLSNMPSSFKRETPHDCLIANNVPDGTGSGINRIATLISTITLNEALNTCGADSPDSYQQAAVMGTAGIFRAFTTSPTNTGLMPGIQTAPISILGITSTKYNPFVSGNDISIFTWGNEYSGFGTYSGTVEYNNIRAIGLRGPLMVVGWGYAIEGWGAVVPASTGNNTIYTTDYLRKTNLWKAGPVDLLWDERRGVWTSHDIILGVTDQVILPGATGLVTVYSDFTPLSWKLNVTNFFSAGVSGNKKVSCGYSAHSNKFWILSADC
jgi:hypothetical protein